MRATGASSARRPPCSRGVRNRDLLLRECVSNDLIEPHALALSPGGGEGLLAERRAVWVVSSRTCDMACSALALRYAGCSVVAASDRAAARASPQSAAFGRGRPTPNTIGAGSIFPPRVMMLSRNRATVVRKSLSSRSSDARSVALLTRSPVPGTPGWSSQWSVAACSRSFRARFRSPRDNPIRAEIPIRVWRASRSPACSGRSLAGTRLSTDDVTVHAPCSGLAARSVPSFGDQRNRVSSRDHTVST
jgi:hypothetical protein